MADATINWVATLSDGTTVAENTGEYLPVPGLRKPWVRLCENAANDGLHLTSLRLNYKGRTIHMPRSNFDRFNYNETSSAPDFYSLSYHLEGEIDESGMIQKHFIDLSAHYSTFEVHYVQDLEDGNNSWVVVTEGITPMCSSPQRK